MVEIMVADKSGHDVGALDYSVSMDMDLGDTNDFEFNMDLAIWDRKKMDFGFILYIPGTEYGGLVGSVEVSTKQATVTVAGDTWRGMMAKKIIEPPSGQDYLTVSGEPNALLAQLIGDQFGDLFVVSKESTGISVTGFRFDRYCTLLSGLEDMLASVGYRLCIQYNLGETGGSGWVDVKAVPAENYSDTEEYNKDNRINYTAKEYRQGINHLICAGTGEGTDRTVLHLYVQADGSIGDTKYYTGLDERVALYSYTSQSDTEQLKKDGTKRLQELMNSKQFEMVIENVDLEIGDTVAGRDFTTGILVQKPIVRKILKIEKGIMQVEYKLKGDD